jgi:divalent metal cation (Fe/Co/Zn/Cd) transporter
LSTSVTARSEPLPVAGIRLLPARERERLVRRAKLLAWTGNAWHLLEFAIAVGAGIAASSTALLGFGFDSLIEGFAGFVIVWRFTGHRSEGAGSERSAQRLIAVSYFILVAYIVVEASRSLVLADEPRKSWVGIGLALVTAPTMPLLARAKRRVGRALNSAATEREGTQNLICAYLSIALLAGLGLNALLGWWWADPAAALVIGTVALKEGIESWRGVNCCDVC